MNFAGLNRKKQQQQNAHVLEHRMKKCIHNKRIDKIYVNAIRFVVAFHYHGCCVSEFAFRSICFFFFARKIIMFEMLIWKTFARMMMLMTIRLNVAVAGWLTVKLVLFLFHSPGRESSNRFAQLLKPKDWYSRWLYIHAIIWNDGHIVVITFNLKVYGHNLMSKNQ